MSKKLRVGIIGCGKIANVDHVPGYLSIPGVEVVSLMDIEPSQMDKLNQNHGLDAESFQSLTQFLTSGLDAVSVCTPNCFHYEHTLAAFKAGLHVLCDKPMAAVLPEATRMIKEAEKAGKVLQINHSLHYHAPYVKIAELVQAGKIGTPIHVRCLRSGGTTPDVSWSPGATWFVSKAFQGGVVLDIGVHMAELMQWVAGEITEVASFVDTRLQHIDVPDNANALMRFANGATGMLTLSWTTPVGGGYFEVFGTEGTIRQGFGPEPIEMIQTSKSGRTKTTYPKPKAKLKRSQRGFVDAILGKAPSITPGELGREAVALCAAIQESSDKRRFVKVKRF